MKFQFKYLTRYVVIFSIERVVAVYFPFKRYDINCTFKFKMKMLILIIFSIIFYGYVIFTSGLEYKDSEYVCITYTEWFDIVKVMSVIDTVISMIVPFILITFSNVAIIFKLSTVFKAKYDKNYKKGDPVIRNKRLKRGVNILFIFIVIICFN